MALTQEDCITAHRAEKKRRISTGPASIQPSQYQLVQNVAPRAPSRNALIGRLAFKPPQQQGEYQPPVSLQQSQQSGPRPNVQQVQQKSSTYYCLKRGSADPFIRNCPQPKKPNQGQSSSQNNQNKGKSAKGKLTSPPLRNFRMELLSCRVHSLYTINQLLHYSTQEQLIVSSVTTVVPE
jgi:hypothetical protein